MDKVFLIYDKQNCLNKDVIIDKCVFVREKISIMAFFFTFFWLVYNKLWKWMIFYITVSIVVSCIGAIGIIDHNVKAFVFLCMSSYFAIFSSSIMQDKLIKNKYSLKSIIYADSRESALSKLLLNLKIDNIEVNSKL